MPIACEKDHKKCWTNSPGFAFIGRVRTDAMKTFCRCRKSLRNKSSGWSLELLWSLVVGVWCIALLLSLPNRAAAADATFDFVLKSQAFTQTNAGPPVLQTNSPIQF